MPPGAVILRPTTLDRYGGAIQAGSFDGAQEGRRVKLDYYLAHLAATTVDRRQALRRAAKLGGVAGAVAALGSAALHEQIVQAAQANVRELAPRALSAAALQPDPLTDALFDAAAVEAGAWAPGPYGAGDQRGSFNEVTPQKTAAAWRLLDGTQPMATYNLGELMFEGFPAAPQTVPRQYIQRLAVAGGQAPANAIQLGAAPYAPFGTNRLTYLEERLQTTYQIATQLDGLNHVGVGEMYYNGFRLTDIVREWGTTALGNEHMGPIITRGVLIDVIGMKVDEGATGDYFTAANGGRVLRDTYRITVEDIEAGLRRAGLTAIGPGDVVLFRTGWTHLVRTDPERFVAGEPGIYLREARYLAARRPAIVGSDTWALEVLDPAVTQGAAVPAHNVLITQHGIRINESVVTDRLAEDGVFEFVYIVTPQQALGATAGNTPPAALGQPRQPPSKK